MQRALEVECAKESKRTEAKESERMEIELRVIDEDGKDKAMDEKGED